MSLAVTTTVLELMQLKMFTDATRTDAPVQCVFGDVNVHSLNQVTFCSIRNVSCSCKGELFRQSPESFFVFVCLFVAKFILYFPKLPPVCLQLQT